MATTSITIFVLASAVGAAGSSVAGFPYSREARRQHSGIVQGSRSAVRSCCKPGSVLRLRGGAEDEKVEGHCIGIDLGTTCVPRLASLRDATARE